MTFYQQYDINVPSVNSKFLARDTSNFLLRGLQFVPGSVNELSWSFQTSERTGAYLYDEGTISLVSLGWDMFLFTKDKVTFCDRFGFKLNLTHTMLTGDSTLTLPNISGTVALTSDRYITRVNNEGSATIYPGMAVRVDSATGVKLALSDTVPHQALGVALTQASAAGSLTVVYEGLVTLSDWTASIGSTTLTTGSRYFLHGTTVGTLTTTAPGLPQLIGIAISTTTLLLRMA